MRPKAFELFLFLAAFFFPFAMATVTSTTTEYLTRTVYRVVTETATSNKTTTASVGTILPSATANTTLSGTAGTFPSIAPTQPSRPNAAAPGAQLNSFLAVVVAGVGVSLLV